MELSWTTTITVGYFVVYGFILFLIIVTSYDKTQSFGKWIKVVWKRRALYSTTIIQLYDQATDIGVLVLWGELAYKEYIKPKENNVNHIDMLLMFISGVIIILTSRICVIIVAILSRDLVVIDLSMIDDPRTEEERQALYLRHKQQKRSKCAHIVKSIFLGLFDLYIIEQIWVSHKINGKEPTLAMRTAQWFESVIESLPQIMLQSVFLIRTSKDNPDFSLTDSERWLVILSLIGSIVSTCNKYIWWDSKEFDESFENANVSFKKFPFRINMRYVARSFWRYISVIGRICVLVCLWAVCGGVVASIFLSFILICYCMVALVYYRRSDDSFGDILANFIFYHLIAPIWNAYMPISPAMYITHHFIENLLGLGLITFFAVNIQFDCENNICADSSIRDINKNEFVLLFVVIGWSCSITSALLFRIYLFKYTQWGNISGIPSFWHIYSARWKFNAFLKHTQTEFSTENLIFLTEWLLIKNLILINNEGLKSDKHVESYPNLLCVPLHINEYKNDENSKLNVKVDWQITIDNRFMDNLNIDSTVDTMFELKRAKQNRDDIYDNETNLTTLTKHGNRLKCFDKYRKDYFDKIYSLRSKGDDVVSLNMKFEWNDKWIRMIERNCLQYESHDASFKTVMDNVALLKKHKCQLNSSFVGVYLSCFNRYLHHSSAFLINVSSLLQAQAQQLAKLKTVTQNDILQMFKVLDDCCRETQMLVSRDSWIRFRNSNALITAMAFKDSDNRYIFKLWARKQEQKKREMPDTLFSMQSHLRYNINVKSKSNKVQINYA